MSTTDPSIRFQRRGLATLSVLLRDAETHGLPVLNWTLGSTGLVVGTVITRDNPGATRAAFGVWCATTDAHRWPERTRADGTVHLHAVAEKHRRDGLAVVVIQADIRPHDDPAGIDWPTGEVC
jgi:hypothetical protein